MAKLLIKGIFSYATKFSSIVMSHSFEFSIIKSLNVILGCATGKFGLAEVKPESMILLILLHHNLNVSSAESRTTTGASLQISQLICMKGYLYHQLAKKNLVYSTYHAKPGPQKSLEIVLISTTVLPVVLLLITIDFLILPNEFLSFRNLSSTKNRAMALNIFLQIFKGNI